MSGPRHGTAYRYDLGCRCDECRAAQVAKKRRWRERARAKNSLAYQRELDTARRLKDSYRGVCENCGKPTTGCNGPGSAPRLCAECFNVAREAQHGTRWRYQSPKHRCRCAACKRAMSEYRREMKMAGRVPSHGLSGYKNYGCRCDVCKAAGAAENRLYRERRKAPA